MPKIRRRVFVSGRVQGVWYRDSARSRAEALGVSGSARNLLDGRVELDLEGEPTAVEAMIAWARHGPPRARVDGVVVDALEPAGLSGFRLG
jgi:acylphosphatase